MASQDSKRPSLYPQIDQTNPNYSSPFFSNQNNHQTSSLYPSIHPDDFLNPFSNPNPNPTAPPIVQPEPEPEPVEDTLITIPGAIIHLIDKHYSVHLGSGDLCIRRIRYGGSNVAVFAAVSDEVEWPIIKEEAIVKVDDSHYFFSINDSSSSSKRNSSDGGSGDDDGVLNYGLSFASKGLDYGLMNELDAIFDCFGCFSVQRVSEESKVEMAGVGVVAPMISAEEIRVDEGKRVKMERNCGAYWTTLAPNVEEYSGTAAKLIASGSGQLIKGILWCGDVTVDRLKWGHDVLKNRMDPCSQSKEVDKNTLKRIKRAKRMTKMTKKVAGGVLSGVVKVSGIVTGSVANSKVGKKFFNMLPGEMLLASLDGFNRICDAVEVAGKNVMSTSSTVTTGLVTHKYGEEAGKATHEGMDAAGHAIGTAWAVFKIRKALNPKSAIKPTTLAKSAAKAAAGEYKSKKSSK